MKYCFMCIAVAFAMTYLPAIAFPVQMDTEREDYSLSADTEDQTPLPPVVVTSKKKKQLANTPTTEPKREASIVCSVETPNTSDTYFESMTLGHLKMIINIISSAVNDTQSSHKNYLTIDYGKKIFHSYDSSEVYHRLFDAVETNDITKPRNIWMSHSPCPSCSRRLIYEYGKTDSIKPTIHIASMDLGDGLLDNVDTIKCMAKMVHLNITVTTWDWTDVKNNMEQTKCIESIEDTLQDPIFIESQTTIRKFIEFINELSIHPQVGLWCDLFSL